MKSPSSGVTRTIYLLAIVTLISFSTFAAGTFKPEHSLLDKVLKDHVKNGVVNYKALKSDERLEEYIRYIQNIDTASLAISERLAFWINAYNAWTLKVVVDNYPLKSIKDLGADLVIGSVLKKTIWDRDVVTMNGNTKMTLNEIEHDIIRKYRDARIHFAIVCAAKSCPQLRPEAYTGKLLSVQLDEQTRIFLSNIQKNQLDVEKKKLRLSSIFNWFEGDFKTDIGFGTHKGSVVKFIARYVPSETAARLLTVEKEFDIEYLDYDWNLNE